MRSKDEYDNYLLIKNTLTQQFDIMPLARYQANMLEEYDNYYKSASYGALFNEEDGILQGIANPQVVRTSDSNTSNPLTFNLKTAIVNAYERDPYIQSMLDIVNLYTLDGDITAELTPTNAHKFNTKEDIDKEMFQYLKKDKVEEFNDFIAIQDDQIDLWHHVSIANIQRKVYGLAGIWKLLHDKPVKDKKMKIDFPAGLPLKLVTLDPYYLGQVYINKVTHHITHYKYEDPNYRLIPPEKKYKIVEDKKIEIPNVNYKLIREFAQDELIPTNTDVEMKLPVSQMIVFINTNNQITPNSYGYGSSDIVPILPLSSNTSRINEKILPQINETQYLGVGIIKVKSNSNVDLEKLKDRINKAGGRFATNADVEYIEISNKFDMAGTLEQRQLNIRNMLMKFMIPSPLFNFEEIANKATIDTIVTFLIKRIGKERKYIENVLYRQYYQPLMALYFPDIKYLNLRVRVKLNFPPIDFTSLADKAASYLSLYQADVITKPEIRIPLEFEPFPAQEDMQGDLTYQQQQISKAFQRNQQMSFLKQGAKDQLQGAETNPKQSVTTTKQKTVIKKKE